MERMEAAGLKAWMLLARLAYWANRCSLWLAAPAVKRRRLRMEQDMAEAWESAGETDRAIRSYEAVLRQRPREFSARLGLGRCHLRRLSFQQAESFITAALELEPNQPEANLYAGILAFYAGDLERAKQHLEHVVSGNLWDVKKVSVATEYLGEVALKQGDPTEAVALLEQAITLCPAGVKTERRWILLAEAYQAGGDGRTAIQCLRRALAQNPESDRAWNDLGVLLWTFGKVREARTCLETALAINPDYRDAMDNLSAIRNAGPETMGKGTEYAPRQPPLR